MTWAIRKGRLVSKHMMSKSGKQTIAIHLLHSISRSKDNQKINFSQLTEDNMRTIFLENHSQNMVEELFPDPFLKN